MFQLLTQMLKLPVAVFVYSVEMFAKTLQGIQKLTEQGIDTIFSGVAPTPSNQASSEGAPTTDESVSQTDGTIEESAETTQKEEIKMSDNSLSNDDVKVVEYYILTIKPDYEHILGKPGSFPKVKVFTDNMTDADFASWVIADYFQQEDHEKLLPEDKKYLRVCYDRLCTFKAEEANYDKEEVQVLREIARRLGPGPIVVNPS